LLEIDLPPYAGITRIRFGGYDLSPLSGKSGGAPLLELWRKVKKKLQDPFDLKTENNYVDNIQKGWGN
jgi:hypothetical protein